MKSLYKKIGAMVLASGLLLGVGGLSGMSVVHASSNSSFSEFLSKVPQNQRDDLGSIIFGGGRVYKVHSVYSSSNSLSGIGAFSNCLKMKIDDNFIKSLKEAREEGAEKLGLLRNKYYELEFGDFKILIQVW